jgi:ABC-type transport system involved in cytochrome bd biosynthesis fused ATPase/permease subunit
VITGASGLGKTTMLEALASIRMNEDWKILMNGRCLTSFAQSELEQVFSFAYHDADIFVGSLRSNVTLAKDAESGSVARYEYVINLLGLKHLIDIECHPNTLSSA